MIVTDKKETTLENQRHHTWHCADAHGQGAMPGNQDIVRGETSSGHGLYQPVSDDVGIMPPPGRPSVMNSTETDGYPSLYNVGSMVEIRHPDPAADPVRLAGTARPQPLGASSNGSSQTMVTQTGTDYPRYPEYETLDARKTSYRIWTNRNHSSQGMAEAGLFYTGQRDLCRTFCCGLRLLGWNEGDDPFVEHRKNQPNCPYINSMIQAGLHLVQGRHVQNPPPVNTSRQIGDQLVCSICRGHPIVTQLPCGDIICGPCARGVQDRLSRLDL